MARQSFFDDKGQIIVNAATAPSTTKVSSTKGRQSLFPETTAPKPAETTERKMNKFGFPESKLMPEPAGAVPLAESAQPESIWTRAAKAVLPKKMEDFFGLNKPAAAVKVEKAYEEAYAYEDLQKLQKSMEAGGGKLPKQTAGNVLQETKPEKYLPFVSAVPDIINSYQVYQSAKRVEAGTNTIVDDYRLSKFAAESQRDKTFGAKVTSVLTQLPSFGAELLLTGGVFAAGKEATEKAVTTTLEKALGKTAGRIAAKSVANVAGGTLQTIPARAGEIAAGTIQNMIPEYGFSKNELGQLQPVVSGKGEDIWKAAAQSLSNEWVEVVSEHSGGIFNEAAAPIKNQLLKIGVLKSFLKANPAAKTADFMKWVNRAGWNGVLGEMGEERVGEAARGLLTEVGLSKEGWKIPSKEQLAVELVSFAIPGVMISASNRMAQAGAVEQKPQPQMQAASVPPPAGPAGPGGSAAQPAKTVKDVLDIVGSRDLLTVSKGGADLNPDELAGLQAKLAEYHEKMADSIIEILNQDRNTLADIKVVPYPDGKWGYSFEINTPENGVSADFLSNGIATTREQAVGLARAKMLKYIRDEIANVSAELKDDFQNIIRHIEMVMPGSDVPIVVTKEIAKIEEKKEKLPAEQSTDEFAPGETLIATGREKGMTQKIVVIKQLPKGILAREPRSGIEVLYPHETFTFARKGEGKKMSEEEALKTAKVGLGEFKPGEIYYQDLGRLGKRGVLISGKDKDGNILGWYLPDPESAKLLGQKGGFLQEAKFTRPEEELKIADAETEGQLKQAINYLFNKSTSQKERVAEAVKEKPKTIKEIAEETKILEPNVRRILGVGAKEGTFERVDKGVYVLRKDGKEISYIHTGDAVEILPKLAEEGFKSDMVFLDIPYNTAAVRGGNRGVKYDLISVEEFKKVLQAISVIVRDENTPVFHMYSQATSGLKEMEKYNQALIDAGFKPVARGEYTKLQQDGITQVRNMRGDIIKPEGIILFTKSGEFEDQVKLKKAQEDFEKSDDPKYKKEVADWIANKAKKLDLNFKLIRPKGYQTEKPAEMIKALIEMSTKEGDVVLDPFAGSGVVPAEAVKAGRVGVAIEKSEKAVEELIKPRVEAAAQEARLPKELAGAKPRYGFGSKLFTLNFKSDIDKALYIVAKEIPSKADAKYMEFLQGIYPDASIEEIRAKGKIVRSAIKELARGAEPGNLVIEKVIQAEPVKPTPRFAKAVAKTIPEKMPAQPRFAKPTQKAKQPTQKGGKVLIAHEVAGKLIAKRPNLPILGEFRVKDGILTATDLNVSLSLKSDLADGMYRLVGKEAVKTDTDPAEFPLVPKVKGEATFKATTELLSQTLKSAVLSLSDSDIRPELQGIHFKTENRWITIASTDAYRLFIKQMRAEVIGDGEFILSNPEKVQKVIQAIGDLAEITIGKDAIKFSGENGEVIARRVDGKFPEFKRIMPELTIRYSFEKPRLLSALKELKPFIKDIGDGAGVQISFKDGKMLLLVKNVSSHPEENVHKEIEIALHGTDKVNIKAESINDGVIIMPIKSETAKLNLNADYLIDALNALTEDGAYLYTGDITQNTPVFVSNERELKSEEKKLKAPSGIAATGGAKMGEFEAAAAGKVGGFEEIGIKETTGEEIPKIYEKVKGLIEKYAKSIGEGYLPGRALGIYYLETKNIRIKGMNNLSVAAHEITHFLDFENRISRNIMRIEGHTDKGNPIYDRKTFKLRKAMTELYENYYPGARHNHKLETRMTEGFASLLQRYVEQPSTITAQYPELVKEFLMPGGKYYEPVVGDIIKDLREIIAEYQGLAPLDKIGTRIVNDKVNVNKESFLNFAEKVKTEIADNVFPIEKVAKESGTHFTRKDPSLWVRQYNNSNALILNNLKGRKGFWGWRNGEIKKLHDFNWNNLITDLRKENLTDEFGYYLVARREYFTFQDLKTLEGEFENAKQLVKTAVQVLQDAKETGAELDEYKRDMLRVKKIYEEAERNYKETRLVLEKDGFTEKEVADAYLQNKDMFAPFEAQYDALVKEDLNFLNDPFVQLLDNEDHARLVSQEGYASFKRLFYDEIAGEEENLQTGRRFGGTKVSSLIRRKGSQKAIINPLFSALKNHAEVTRKGLKQVVYNRIEAVAKSLPDVFQIVPLAASPDRTGRILYPQEKDPNIIMARQNFKRVPILADKVIKRSLDEVLNFQNISIFEKLLLGSSRIFTRGTTGLFPGFVLTNAGVDQISAAAQTRNKYIPIYDALARLSKTISKDSAERDFYNEYMVMGGERQTFVGWQDMSPNELFSKLNNERKGLLKAVDLIDAGADILAIPAKYSEIMTRVTEYIKARQAGKPAIVALEEAGRVSAPFHHVGRLGGGRVGQTFIKSIPFFNPGIQVLAQAAETLETPAGRKRFAVVSLAVTAASIASFGLLLSAGSDEQKKLYADINPDELAKYIWIPNPDGKTLIKIRVPDQMAVIATLLNMAAADIKLGADYTAGEYLNAATAWLPQQVNVTQPIRLFMSWIPQIIKPGVLTIAGVKDFPKVMPLESQGLQNRSPGLRTNEQTSPLAAELGKLLNFSPIKLDYLLTGYLGRSVGFITGKPGIYNPFAAMKREYYFTAGRKIQEYYDMKKKNDQDYYDYQHKLRKFKFGEPTSILRQRERLKAVDDLLDIYRDVDIEKYPERAVKLRDKILEKINKL